MGPQNGLCPTDLCQPKQFRSRQSKQLDQQICPKTSKNEIGSLPAQSPRRIPLKKPCSCSSLAWLSSMREPGNVSFAWFEVRVGTDKPSNKQKMLTTSGRSTLRGFQIYICRQPLTPDCWPAAPTTTQPCQHFEGSSQLPRQDHRLSTTLRKASIAASGPLIREMC